MVKRLITIEREDLILSDVIRDVTFERGAGGSKDVLLGKRKQPVHYDNCFIAAVPYMKSSQSWTISFVSQLGLSLLKSNRDAGCR
jgi:hypothetical protein